MKKILPFICILLIGLCIPAYAIFVGQRGAGGVGASGGVSYIVEQRLEGTGYDNGETWTESGNMTMDEDYTTTVLEGSQSLRIAATAQNGTIVHVLGVTKTEMWGYFRIRYVTLTDNTKYVFSIRDTGDNYSYSFETNSSGQWVARINGSGTSPTVNTMSTGTTYHCWWHVKNGTGNAIASFGFSATTTEPTSGDGYISKTDGTEADSLEDVVIGWPGNCNQEFILDMILIRDDQTVGDNPS